MFAAAQPCGGKACAELHALDRRNGEHGTCDQVFQSPEHRLSDASRKPVDHAFDHAADGIPVRPCLRDLRLHGRCRIVGNSRERLFRDWCVKRRAVRGVPDGQNACADGNAFAFQQLHTDAARNAQRRGQPSGKVPAAAYVLRAAEFDLRGVVRVAGAGDILQIFIIAGACVGVADDGRERRAAGFSVFQPA